MTLQVMEQNDLAQCPFKEFGCSFQGDFGGLRTHVRESPTMHLSMVCDGVNTLAAAIQQRQLANEKDERALDFLTYRIRSLDIVFSCHLIWRIDNVNALLRDAREDVRQSIFSPPFYTGKHGYKLALSAALNGDGVGKGKHIALYMTILKGEYDQLLPWPFAHPITFKLIDQNSDVHRRSNVEHTLKPNTCKENRPFLGKPVGERNPRLGIQKFLDLKQLYYRDYIRDDVMYFEVAIDTANITHI